MPQDERQELRLALVMNGGVSLAVWMGGVTRELDRVRRADGAYGRLLDLTHARARIDVIAGSSAGGINGAVLAMAIARGATVEGIRKLWMEEGSIADLLRDPTEADAPSVLQGDGRLLAGLRRAMQAIVDTGVAAASTPDAPLHLVITGTTLAGEVRRYPDRFGATIADVTHRALFHFCRPPPNDHNEDWRDDFADPDAPGRLALAARSSASFPAAFEPSFVPVGSGADATHPDMRGVADFSATRWLIDGGVLDNTPFRPALDAIRTLPAEAPVRRVLGYVVPDPVPPEDEVVSRADMPRAAEVVLDALSRLPRAQTIGRELEQIEENNRSVRHRRDARENTLTATGPGDLERIALALLPAYVQTRRESAVYDVVRLLLEGAPRDTTPDRERIAEVRRAIAETPNAPWLPPVDVPGSWDAIQLQPWRWGFAPVQNAANVALDLLQRVVALQGLDGDEQARAMELRGLLHHLLRHLRSLADANAKHWRDTGQAALGDPTAVGGLMDEWESSFARRLGGIAGGIADVITQTAALLSGSAADAPEARALASSLAAEGGSTDATLRRLLALDVVQRSSGADLADIEQPVELVLMSADSACAFGVPKQAEDKLAGLQVGHFGGFYKRSWRANDWMWGRLDGADRLVRTLLDPRRVQRRLRGDATPETLADEVKKIACDAATEDMRDYLEKGWRRGDVLEELRALDAASDEPPPGALEASYKAIRRRVQLEILADEIPAVATAAAEDVQGGANPDSLGATWARRLEQPLDPDGLVSAFGACPVGEEKIQKEVGSDYFTKVSTTGAATLGSVLGGALPDRKLFRVVRPVLAVLRGLLLTLYLLGRGAVESSATERFLVALTLAVGGALVAVYAVGTDVPGFLLLLGASILIAGVLLARIRKKHARLVLAAIVFAGSAAGYYGVRAWDGRPAWADELAAVVAVVLMATSAMWLGYSGRRRLTPPR